MRVRFASLRWAYEADLAAPFVASDAACMPAASGGASRWRPDTEDLDVVTRDDLAGAPRLLGRRFAVAAAEVAAEPPHPGWRAVFEEVLARSRLAAVGTPGARRLALQLAANTNLTQSDGGVHRQRSARLRIACVLPGGLCARVGTGLPWHPEEALAPALAATADLGRRLAGMAPPRPAAAGHPPVPRGGQIPVLFAGDAACLLAHELLGHLLEWTPGNARRVERLGGVDRLFTVHDHPAAPSYVTYERDSEDVPVPRATPLIDRGEVLRFLHDRRSAREAAAAPTGNGRRADYVSPPRPRMSLLRVAAGGEPPDRLLAAHPPVAVVRQVSGARVYRERGIIRLDTPWLLLPDPDRGGEVTAGPAMLFGTTDTLLTGGVRALSDRDHASVHQCEKDGQRLNVVVQAPDMVADVGVRLATDGRAPITAPRPPSRR